ncbi:disulfide bond formation protein DsbB [Salinisphaera sp. S4-8]|uniref:disulfide bond formation protein B n=1 Tax=Salinisphaera sp. S4-8 TaxID=633357 RepID=UPI00333F9081
MSTRIYFLAGFLAAAGGLVFAYYLQYFQGLDPCPLCIFQRVAMAGVALFCLIGWAHGAHGVAHRVYAALAGLSALAGAGIAARHVWLMNLPPDQVPACGPGLDYLIDIMPLTEVLATVLRGDASCAEVKGAFLGVSLPAWTGVYFVLLAFGALAGVLGFGARPRPRL